MPGVGSTSFVGGVIKNQSTMQTIGELIREKNLELATTDLVAWAKSRREEAHAEMLEV